MLGIELIAPGVYLLTGRPRYAINCYLLVAGDSATLVDSRVCWSKGLLLRQLATLVRGPRGLSDSSSSSVPCVGGAAGLPGGDSRPRLSLVLLTHAHPDHRGSVAAVCAAYGVPLACPDLDADAAEGKVPLPPGTLASRLIQRLVAGPPHPVARRLADMDLLPAGWRVVAAPGHTPGHSMLYRESDGVVLAADVAANINFLTRSPGLHEPPRAFSSDPARNRDSIRLLASLKPKLVAFGHGPPLAEIEKLAVFAGELSE